MADYRTIHNKIWDDTWFHALSAEEKLLWFYLITNRRGSVAGIFELPEWVIEAETGLNATQVQSAIDNFTSSGKVQYEDGIVWVINMRRYQCTSSNDLLTKVQKDLDLIPDRSIKARYAQYHEDGTLPTPSPHPPDTRARARSEPNRTDTRRTCTEPIRDEPKQRKPRAASAPPDPNVTLLIDYYHTEFQRIHPAVKPKIQGLIDGQAIKKLLKDYSPEKLQTLMIRYLESDNHFYQEKGYPIWLFAKDIVGIELGGNNGKRTNTNRRDTGDAERAARWADVDADYPGRGSS